MDTLNVISIKADTLKGCGAFKDLPSLQTLLLFPGMTVDILIGLLAAPSTTPDLVVLCPV